MSVFKTKPAPAPAKRPDPVKAPEGKSLVPYVPSSNDALNTSSPDGPRDGFTVMPSGRRAYREEIPFPPPEAPRKPFKVK